ncbi:MAG: phosphatase PAP2 family protein [Syntrophales bacterium]|jgi:membrane-associated phospholipid phosphatase|nr:phosphatase PAP2 family protein [Syntrophales bacterium]MDD4340545.1 phosphatase PAP2 family protein [Syntrophales bacterium]
METVWNMGISWNLFFQNLGTGLRTPMEAFSFLGTEQFLLLLMPALYWCVEAGIGLRVGVILLLNAGVNDGLKLAFHGPRPYWYSPEVMAYARETSFGLPSGHAQMAFAVWGMLAAIVNRGWGWAIALLVVLLIGISRLYLGVHFLHDVVVGWLIGAGLLWLVLRTWQPVATRLKSLSGGQQFLASFLASLGLFLFSLIPFLWLNVTGWQPLPAWVEHARDAMSLNASLTAAGTLFGLLAGMAWLNRRGGFDTSGALWQRILRYLLGLAGILVLYLGLKVVFGWIAPHMEAALPYLLRYVRYALVGAWVSAGAPWMFVNLNLAKPASPFRRDLHDLQSLARLKFRSGNFHRARSSPGSPRRRRTLQPGRRRTDPDRDG